MERADGVMTASEIVKVIKACREAGVTKLDMYGIHLEFKAEPEPQPELPSYQQPVVDAFEPEAEPETDQEFMESQMLIDDPLALEEMVMQGDN